MLRFGTDGVRGRANTELTPALIMALGRAAAHVLGPRAPGRPVLIGRDTRLSGPLIQAALSAGLASEGYDVVDVGVLPTPGVAYLSAEAGAPAAVVSASHNPFWDNGVKFFSPGGLKLDDATEQALEHELARLTGHSPDSEPWASESSPRLARDQVGSLRTGLGGAARYEQFLLNCLEGRRLRGLRVALDCAHGAASVIGPRLFEAAGAEVVAVLACRPDGTNINRACGSTDPSALAAAVTSTGAHLGLALDGDADRVIAVAENGHVVDGDRLLALFATDLSAQGRLEGETVVVTVMTNLGFHQAMTAGGLKVHTVNVGDRNVLEALDAHGWALGGEQSGHIIFRRLATTGDGLLSGLLLADLVRRRRASLADLAASSMTRAPQVLVNVAVADRDGLARSQLVWDEVHRWQSELGDGGRVLLRPSGTEALVRVMVEAPEDNQARAVAERLAAVLVSELGEAP